MKKIIALIILSTLISCGTTNILKEKLNGNVKSVKQVSYKITDYANNKIVNKEKEKFKKAIFYSSKNDSSHIINYKDNFTQTLFQKNGKVQVIKHFKENGNLKISYNLSYDNNKLTELKTELITEEETISWIDGKTTRKIDTTSDILIWKYKYNENKDVTEILTYRNDANPIRKLKYEYLYDKSNVRKKTTIINDSIEKIETYLYNKREKKTQHKSYNSIQNYQKDFWYSKIIIKYDNKKNTATKQIYFRDKLPEVVTIEIKNGLEVQEKFSGIEVNYKYSFDKKGNWITKTIYNYNEPKYFIERTIEYY